MSAMDLKAIWEMMKILGVRFLAIFVAVLLLKTATAYGETLIMVADDFPPWTIIDKNDDNVRISGIDVEFVTEIAKRMNFDIELKNCPFKRCLRLMELGEADIQTSLLRRSEREKYMHYFETPYKTITRKVFYLRKESTIRIRTYDDLSALNVGAILGFNYFPEFDSDQKISKTPIIRLKQAVRMLEAGRIDTFVSSESVGDYVIAIEGFGGKFRKAEYYFEKRTESFLTFSKKSPLASAFSEFNKVYEQLLREGVLDEIKSRYFAKSASF
ncbi:MAG: transporter substrate-binding domain-containing protein [Hyphomicrobiaceae bacterium]